MFLFDKPWDLYAILANLTTDNKGGGVTGY